MGITVNIPDSVLEGIRIPRPGLEERLKTELAIALYQTEAISPGKAAELAGMTRFAFGDLLVQRGIPRHYEDEDLAQDLTYARR